MNIIKDEGKKLEILQRIRDRSFTERSGIHFSDLNYCLRKAYYRNKYQAVSEQETEDTTLIFSMGHAWEYWLTNKDDHDETELDGIVCTPDYTHEDGEYWEIKATYLSARKDVSEQTNWLRQTMAYCKVNNITTFYIVCLHIMGTWDGIWKKKGDDLDKRKPLMNVWRIEYTQEEIDKNWILAQLKRGILLDAMDSDEPPEQTFHESWECGYCIWNKQKVCPIPAGQQMLETLGPPK